MQIILPYIVPRFAELNIKHEVHHFDSGATMVDVWIENRFYCIQIDNHSIGLSLITPENPGFDTIPDAVFKNYDLFKSKLEAIVNP